MQTNKTITLFNAYLGENRLEVYHPTVLSVHYHESRGSSLGSGGTVDSTTDYRIRIPYPQAGYVKSGYSGTGWTLRKGDLIVPGNYKSAGDLTKAQITALGVDVITITEFADDTVHGSDRVKHWRIGGK